MKKYRIGDNVYVQKPLVIGQVKQLLSCLEGLTIHADIDVIGLIALLGERLPQALSVILTPEGMAMKDKDIKSLAEELAFTLDIETAMEVIEDFFDFNPISSLFEKLGLVMGKIQSQFQPQSTNSSVSSPPEISLGETKSNGGTP